MEELKEHLLCGSTEETLSLFSQECGINQGALCAVPNQEEELGGENDVIVADAH